MRTQIVESRRAGISSIVTLSIAATACIGMSAGCFLQFTHGAVDSLQTALVLPVLSWAACYFGLLAAAVLSYQRYVPAARRLPDGGLVAARFAGVRIGLVGYSGIGIVTRDLQSSALVQWLNSPIPMFVHLASVSLVVAAFMWSI